MVQGGRKEDRELSWDSWSNLSHWNGSWVTRGAPSAGKFSGCWVGRREGPEAAESGQRSWPTLASAVCPLGRHVVREEGGQRGGGQRVAACQASIFFGMLVKPAGKISVCENICNSVAEVELLVRAMHYNCPLCVVFLPHCHTEGCRHHALYPPTQSGLFHPSMQPGLIFASVLTWWQDFLMTGSQFALRLPSTLIVALAPVDTVLNYLIDASTSVTLSPPPPFF